MPIIKKIFFVCLLVFFISLLLWGVYNLSFKKTPAPVADNEPAPANVPVPAKNAPAISTVSDEAVIAPVLSPDGNYIKYYSKQTGKVYQIDLNGQNKSTVSDHGLSGLQDVLWSPDQTKAIHKFIGPDGQAQFSFYDYGTQKSTPLKSNVDQISWATNSNKIFYKYYDASTKGRTLNISDPDGSNWNKLADINYRDISIDQIPQSGLVSFWNKPDAFTGTIFQSMPIISGDTKTILQGKFGADYLWSPDGNNVLVSNTDVRGGSKMQLAVMNSNGGEFKNLDLPTMVSKCAWSKDNKTVYCAFPTGIPDSAIMPNDYLANKFNTTDTFWKIDTVTGKKDRPLEANQITGQYDAAQLFFNTDESQLFFVNKGDGKIMRIDL
jgi:hypothetical protein